MGTCERACVSLGNVPRAMDYCDHAFVMSSDIANCDKAKSSLQDALLTSRWCTVIPKLQLAGSDMNNNSMFPVDFLVALCAFLGVFGAAIYKIAFRWAASRRCNEPQDYAPL